MNLPSSIFVTTFIVAVVWLAAVFQPGQAVAYNDEYVNTEAESAGLINAMGATAGQQMAAVEKVNPTQSIQPSSPSPERAAPTGLVPVGQLVGITQNISLAGIDALWMEFTNKADLHERVMFDQGSIYVLYRELSSNFDRAQVTIGYNSAEVKGRNSETVVPQGDYEVLLNMGKHSASSLRNAWNGIDYGKNVEALVERHVIDDAGQVTSAGLFVLYR